MVRPLSVVIVLFASLFLGVYHAAGEEVEVYILAGQSNMDGRGLVEELEKDHAEYAKPQPEIKIWYANTSGQGYSTGWTDLAPGMSIPPKFTKGEGKLPSWTFGCELSFGPAMAAQTKGKRVALIKFSQGGTSLKRDWALGLEEEDALYEPFIKTVKQAMAALKEQGHIAKLKGMVWHQGESDRKLKSYDELLESFIGTVRKDLGEPMLPVVIGEVFDNGQRDQVRAAQRKAAERVSASVFVSSEGLETADGTHFTTASTLEFGKRYAKALQRLTLSPKQEKTQAPKQEARGNDRPNVLLIITDQQFADAMSCVDPKWIDTPGMDAIAEKGVRFTNAYVNFPTCMPQRYTMMTGRLPLTRRQADPNNKPTISLGNQARQAGYTTACFGKWHIQDKTFTRDDTEHAGFEIESGGKDKTMTDSAAAFFSEYRDKRGDKPFFTVVSYYNPHDICEWGRKKAGFKNRIDMKNGEIDIDPPLHLCPPLPDNYAVNKDEATAVTIRRQGTKGGKPNAQNMAMSFTPNEWRQYRWAYNRFVELVDKQVVRLLDSLRENGLDDNTVIIFTSDHGDGIGAHRWHQKSILYEESARVPFLISVPGSQRQNETDPRLVSVGIDLMATVSDLVDTEMPDGPYYGISALPFAIDADAKAKTHEYVVTEAEVNAGSGVIYEGRSVRSARFKYHAWNRGEIHEQLFDMVNDPGETTNLAGQAKHAKQLHAHRAMLNDWLERTEDTYEVHPSLR